MHAFLALSSVTLAAAQEVAGTTDRSVRIVTTSSGDPVPDASISLLTGDSVLVDHAVSDQEGRASLEASPESYRIRLPILWQETWWRANLRTPAPPEIRLKVNAVTLERRGLVRGVGRVPGDSIALESE